MAAAGGGADDDPAEVARAWWWHGVAVEIENAATGQHLDASSNTPQRLIVNCNN